MHLRNDVHILAARWSGDVAVFLNVRPVAM
jgi:hypothetical protein